MTKYDEIRNLLDMFTTICTTEYDMGRAVAKYEFDKYEKLSSQLDKLRPEFLNKLIELTLDEKRS